MPSNESILRELEIIAEKAGGLCKPEDVVEFAKDEATALHSQFEWDDTEAASQYRLHQARNIIRVCVTIRTEDRPPVRAFVSLSPDRGNKGGGGYRRISDVMNSAEFRATMLEDAKAELRIVRAKYSAVKELVAIWKQIDLLSEHGSEPDPGSVHEDVPVSALA